MRKLSIIVAAYNAEKYIKRCIDSILIQSFTDYELIIINDGSNDNTGKICDEYASMDHRIVVIHQKNMGLMSVRHKGVSLAKGEYIGFVDADDWIEKDFYNNLIDIIGTNDIVISGAIHECANNKKYVYNKIKSGEYNTSELLREMYSMMLCIKNVPFEFGILPYMCNKIFKRNLLFQIENEIDKRISDGEDVAQVFPYLLNAKKIIISDYCGYHYMIHSQSMSHKKTYENYENEVRLYLWLYKKFNESVHREILIPQLNNYMLMMMWKNNATLFDKYNKFMFPFSKIPINSNIIIYGNGNMGKIFCQQIKKTSYCNIVGVADKSHLKDDDIYITPYSIKKIEFDYIVIAIDDEDVRNSVVSFFENEGIDINKIICPL